MSQTLKPTRSIRLPPEEVEAVIKRMRESRAPHGPTRATERHPFHARNVPVEITQPGGSTIAFLVDTHCLSAGGVGFLHGGFLHVGTRCMFQLPTTDNAWQNLSARVVRCQHVERGLHDIGAEWLDLPEPLDLAQFIGSGSPKLRVLLIEDSPSIRTLVSHHLKKAHIDLTNCETLAAARDAFAGSKWDLALVDIMLPDGSGEELARDLRQQHSTTYLIAFTANNSDEERERLLNSGFDAFLGKPFKPEQLTAALQDSMIEPYRSELGCDEDTLEIVRGFLSELPNAMLAIASLVDAKDFTGAAAAARQLVAGAGSYGFPPIAAAGEELLKTLTAAEPNPADAWQAYHKWMRVNRRAEVG